METVKTKAYMAALLYACIVGFSFLGTKTCVEVTTPLITLIWRYNMGCVGGLILIISGIVRIKFKGRDSKKLILPAAFYIGFMAVQAIGLNLATSIEGGIVFAMVPIFAQGIAFFLLRERTSALQNVFILISVAGIVIMYTWGSVGLGDINPAGFFILLLSSLLMAFSNVFMRYARTEFKALEVGCCIVIMGCIFFNLVFIANFLLKGIFPLTQYISPFTGGRGGAFTLAILYLGIPCMLFTSTLITYALSRIEAVKGTIFGNLSLVIAVLAGMLLRGEPFFLYHFISTFLIIAGVIGTNIFTEKTTLSGGKL